MPWLYDNPETLDYSNIDEPIRDLCRKINSSAWLRTEESCAGHPANESSAWNNQDLYLRLVVLKNSKFHKLLMMMDKIREGYSGLHWSCTLLYDRQDELGTHWYFGLVYGKQIRYRDIAIDLVTRKFLEVNQCLEH